MTRLNTDFALDRAAFLKWAASGGDNSDMIRTLAKALTKIIETELTDTQRLYVVKYYYDGLTMEEIGELYGRHRSTVSRVIKSARHRMYRHLKYTNPDLLDAPEAHILKHNGHRIKV